MRGYVTTITLNVMTKAGKTTLIKQSFKGFDYTQETSLRQAERHAEEYLKNKYILDYEIDGISIKSV